MGSTSPDHWGVYLEDGDGVDLPDRRHSKKAHTEGGGGGCLERVRTSQQESLSQWLMGCSLTLSALQTFRLQKRTLSLESAPRLSPRAEL